MSRMIFTLLSKPDKTLDLSVLTPDLLARAGDRHAIAALKVRLGNEKIRIGELFTLQGNDANDIEIRRTNEYVQRIGYGMTKGRITVKSHAGDYLGEAMQGGSIHVHGHCGNWLGWQMRWGRIEVMGDAGHAIGCGRHGMDDGLITVWGNAGDRAGQKMRRGMILIAKDAGDYTGANMIAGTVVVLGKCGHLPGYGMKRGTIIMQSAPALMGAGMVSCGHLKMAYLRLFFKQLSRMGSRYRRFKHYGPEVHRYAGDMAENGKGELLVLLNTPK